jgi:transcriptional regulator with XRE-family HTH domain
LEPKRIYFGQTLSFAKFYLGVLIIATFTERLQQLKMNRNSLQKDIATAAGISLRTYQRYESGERVPDTETLMKIADYFNVSTDYILGRSDDPNRY